MRKVISYQITEEDMDITAAGLVNLVLKNCMHLTGREVSRAKFRKDGILLDGEPVTVKKRMVPGQTLTICLEDTALLESKVVPVKGDVEIIYEDEDIVFVNKPAGQVVHPSHGHFFDSVGNYLAYHYEERKEDTICRVIGRLDKDTSGLLLFAKNQAAAARMTRQKQEGESSRLYLALVTGIMEEKTGSIEVPLRPIEGDKLRQEVNPDGLYAYTTYEVAEEFGDYSLLKVQIATGRTHQIRVHMAYLGHPLLGDPLYGVGDARINRTALHSYQVECLQPFQKEKISVKVPMPEDMAALCKRK